MFANDTQQLPLLYAVVVEERKDRREGEGSLSVRRREQPGLQIATKRDTKEGNASDTMHACSWTVGCQC